MWAIPKAFSGLVPGVLHRPQSEASSSTLAASPHDRTSSNRTVRMPAPVEEVASSSPPQSGKRRRSEEADSPGRNRKSSRNSDNAQSLVPHYQKTPTDATQIKAPVYDPEADWNTSPPSRGQQPKMGGPYRPPTAVRPTNTLGHQSVQSRNQRKQSSAQALASFKQFTNANKSRQQQLLLSTSRGSNVAPLELEDDLEAERPPHKKSKRESSLVDSTDFDYIDGEAMPARPGNRRSTSYGSATEVSERSRKKAKGGGDAFGNNELYTADKKSGNWGPKPNHPFPKDKGRIAAPQRLVHNGQSHAERDHDSNGTAQNPVDVDADDSQLRIAPPMMNLMEGVQEAGDAHKQKRREAQQGSPDDMAKVGDVFESAGYSRQPNAKARTAPTKPTRRSIPQSQLPPSEQDSARGMSRPNARQEHPSGDTRWHFSRDTARGDGDDQRVGTIRMHSRTHIPQPISSSRPQARDHSPDVLDGETTIGSQRSRSASPKKSAQSRTSGNAGVVQGYVKARPSESSLKPTKFTRASDQRPAIPENTGEDIWEPSDDADDGRIDMAAIICKGVVNSKPGNRLVWDANNECFMLADASGSYVYSPLQKLPVRICKSAVTHGLITNNASLKVILKGSADWMSNGTILLDFLTAAGKDFFYGAFCDSFGTQMINEDHEQLDAKFTHLANIEREGFLRARDRAQKHAHKTRRALVHAQSRADEESIIYEGDEQPPQREKLHGLPKWAKSVVYPQVGTRRVTVDVDDLRHLDAGEFLNDNIVNYALRHIEETMDPAHKDRVHFFNTFFFSSLTTKNGKREFNYDAVKKWTKNADLLSKPYIIVPINLNLHWFVAIIYNLPALQRKMIHFDDDPAPEDAVDLCSESEVTSARAEEPHATAEQMAQNDVADVSMDERHVTQDQALEVLAPAGQTAGSQTTIKGKKGKKRRGAPIRTFATDQPMIISLDSFGLTRTTELRIIKRYVIEEAREKRQVAVALDDLQGVNAKGIPQQDNFWDCGVYLIGYMKEFARDPDRFVAKILGRQIDENDFKEFSATALRDEIRENLIEFGNGQNEQHRKDKLARASARKNGQTLQVGDTPSGASTPARAKVTNADASVPPTSSQPTRRTSSRRGPAQLFDSDVGGTEDELEVEAPQPLTKSHKALVPELRSTHIAEPKAEQDHGDDEEMLDNAGPPVENVDAPRPATPLRHSVTVAHNAGLSPLSSLEKDTGDWPRSCPPFTRVNINVATRAQPAATVKTKEDSSFGGSTADAGNNEPEVPDSQPDAQQGQAGRRGEHFS
ncbi:hypothetical protein BST61_g5754 [Cercospora zeina]